MTVLCIALGAVVAVLAGWSVIRRHEAQERRLREAREAEQALEAEQAERYIASDQAIAEAIQGFASDFDRRQRELRARRRQL